MSSVLVISRLDRDAMARSVGISGRIVMTAKDCREGGAILKSLLPTCLFLDLDGQAEEAVELVRELRTMPTHANVVVIAIETSTEPNLQHAGTFDCYLRRPFDLAALRGLFEGPKSKL